MDIIQLMYETSYIDLYRTGLYSHNEIIDLMILDLYGEY